LKLTTYVIHLKRAVDRQKNVETLREHLPGLVKVLDAVDSQELSASDISSFYKKEIYRPHYPFTLRQSEIACFMSYRKAWQTLIDSGDEYCLIVEDDVLLNYQEFPRALDFVLNSACSDSYIRFPIKNRELVQSVIKCEAPITHFVPKVIGLGMVMQLVGRGAAKRLLEVSKFIDRPVDTLMQMTWVTKVYPSVVYPSGVTEISDELGGSTIGARKSFGETIYREIMRPIYRLKLWIYAKRTIID
jgi:GR25 family glycosyltransferase involved in LPS biosynthesis